MNPPRAIGRTAGCAGVWAGLVSQLAETAGCAAPTLLARLGPPLLQQLAADVELWGPASSELLAVQMLLRLTG